MLLRAGIAVLLVLPLAARAATSEVPLSALKGKSIDVAMSVVESHLWIDGTRRESMIVDSRYRHRIYVSPAGRIFDKRQFFDRNSSKPFSDFENVNNLHDQWATFDPSSGIIIRSVFSNDHRTTFVDQTTIHVSADAGKLSCSVERQYVLRSGETQFVEYQNEHTQALVQWQKVTGSTCTVMDGNIFKSGSK